MCWWAAVAQGAMQLTSSIASGLSSASTANYNARAERRATYQQEAMQRKQSERDIATQTVALGAQGTRVDEGTPLLLLKESARNAELDALQIRKTGLQKSAAYEAEAKNDLLLGFLGAGADAMGTVSKVYQLAGSSNGKTSAQQSKTSSTV